MEATATKDEATDSTTVTREREACQRMLERITAHVARTESGAPGFQRLAECLAEICESFNVPTAIEVQAFRDVHLNVEAAPGRMLFAVSPGVYGIGKTVREAVANLRKSGGRASDRVSVFDCPEGTEMLSDGSFEWKTAAPPGHPLRGGPFVILRKLRGAKR